MAVRDHEPRMDEVPYDAGAGPEHWTPAFAGVTTGRVAEPPPLARPPGGLYVAPELRFFFGVAMSLAALRQELAQVIDAPQGRPPGVATGLPELDQALGGALPRGQVTAITGPPGAGRTTLLRRLVEAAIRQELLVAYVDAERTLNPRDWAHLARRADDDGLWVIRPPDPGRAAWCSELLVRSGAFPVVVLDGGPVLPHAITVRLASLAREHDAALILSRTVENSPGRNVTVTVRGRAPRIVEVKRDIVVARRLCAHPEVPDRRGVERRRHAPARHGRVG